MNIYDEVTYKKESEIDNAFPYLDKLNKEIDELNKQILSNKKNTAKKRKFKLFSFILKEKNEVDPIKEKRKLIKSHTYKKDGYIFKIVLYNVSNELNNNLYFEFYSNIIYVNEIRQKEFYKQFFDKNEAKKHFENMEYVFKILKRRDLMEKLFNLKLQEISLLKSSLINR